LQKVVVEGEGWRDAGNGTWGSADAQGVVTVGDEGGRLRRLEGSGPDAEAGAAAGAFGPQGRLYVAAKEGLTVIDGGERRVLSPAVRGRGVVARSDGSVFVAGTSAEGEGRVWLVKPDGTARVVDTGLKKPTGVTLSSDQWLLYVAEGESHWVYSYVVGADGTLAHKQKFYDLYVRDADDDAGAGGLCGDAEGRLYVATRAGVQVCDQAGRVNFILPMPAGTPAAAAAVTAVWFGGKDGLTLYAAAGGRVFARPVKVKGAVPFGPPAKPPQPRL
jgi:sugar lactone lactonase YvrE